MSNAMEKMVAQMLGFTPQELHNTLSGFRDMIVTTAETLNRIEVKLDTLQRGACDVEEIRKMRLDILNAIGALKDDDRNDDRNNRPERDGGTGSGGDRLAANGTGDAI